MRIIANEIYTNYINAKQNAIITDEELPEISSAEMEIVRNMGDVPYEVAMQRKADAEFQCECENAIRAAKNNPEIPENRKGDIVFLIMNGYI